MAKKDPKDECSSAEIDNRHDSGDAQVKSEKDSIPKSSDLVSILGVLAQTTVPIIYKDLRVPLWMKKQIWQFVKIKH